MTTTRRRSAPTATTPMLTNPPVPIPRPPPDAISLAAVPGESDGLLGEGLDDDREGAGRGSVGGAVTEELRVGGGGGGASGWMVGGGDGVGGRG